MIPFHMYLCKSFPNKVITYHNISFNTMIPCNMYHNISLYTMIPFNTYHNISYFKYDGTVSYAS